MEGERFEKSILDRWCAPPERCCLDYGKRMTIQNVRVVETTGHIARSFVPALRAQNKDAYLGFRGVICDAASLLARLPC